MLEQIEVYALKKMDFAFETTLSGTAYLGRFKKLKRDGYLIHLFFLWIPDVKLSLARVANRVKMGGHGISEKVVRRRFHKGIGNFFKHYRQVLDSWILFDGSERVPRPIAEDRAGEFKILDQGLYDTIQALAEGK